MSKIVFIILFLTLILYASPRYIDFYYANGMMGETKTKEKDTWKEYVKTLQYINPDISSENSTAKVAYNANELWGIGDAIEVVFQKLIGDIISWGKVQRLLREYVMDNDLIEYFNGLSQAFNSEDLQVQINAYKTSLRKDHSLIVVAHSQGNFFTNKVYETLSSCQQHSFKMIGVASPSAVVSGGGARTSFDNDPVPLISLAPTTVTNKNRFIIGGVDLPSFSYHAFQYYMGGKRGDSEFTTQALAIINSAISSAVDSLLLAPEITPKSGIINVQLTWGDAQIDMNLDVQMPFGEKDITDCRAVEHYYVESEEDIKPGTYPVYINNIREPAESLLPQNIYLAIDTLGEAITFDFNITLANMLNIGHVANIIIAADGNVDFVSKLDSTGHPGIVTHYGGSGDGSGIDDGSGSGSGRGTGIGDANSNGGSIGNNDNNDSDNNGGNSDIGDYNDYLYKVQSKLKQAVMGPLSDATVEIFEADNYVSGTPLYTGTTIGGTSLLTAGVIYFPSSTLVAIEDDKLYVLLVKGGTDIDANDDGVLDDNTTVNNGTIRAILSGDQLKNDDFKVNILTEITYQLTKEMLHSELNVTAVKENLDSIAQKLLVSDVNDDAAINYSDVLHWLPMFDKEKLLKKYNTFYEPIVQKVYIDQEIYEEAYVLVNEPIFRQQEIHVSENTVAGAVLGKIRVDLYEGSVNYTLSGEYSDLFEIAEDGSVSLSNTASLDYETMRDYTINLSADIGAQILYSSLAVTVDDVPDAPFLGGFTSYIDENSQLGTHIGKLYIDPGLDTVTEILLLGDGNEHFTVDLEGNIAIASEAVIDYEAQNVYRLQAVAYNSYGYSWPVSIIIYLNDLPESPVLQTLATSVREDAVAGTVVGTMEIIENGSPVTSMQLGGDGCENFNIDKNGTISVSQIADLDFISRAVYTLSAQATNVYGLSQSVAVIIHLLPAAPTLIGSYDTSEYVMNVILSDDKRTAYIANGRNGLQIIDITDPTKPSQIGSYKTPGFASRVILSIDGSNAYVVDYYNGLQIIDITDPTTPSLIGNIDTPSYGQNITLSPDETIAYYTTIYNGLQIIDVSNPMSPFLITSYDTSGYPNDVVLAANGTVAYVSNYQSGLLVLDVTNPALPLKIESYATFGYALNITLSEDENTAYIASDSGLEIIDVSTPSIPKYIGNYDAPGHNTYGVTLSSDENVAYIANDDSGLQIIDISDPSLPVYRNSFDTWGSTRDIALSADNAIAYVADGNNSFVIISVGF